MASSEASENVILNDFRNKEESRICWARHSESVEEGSKYYPLLVLFCCEALGAAPTSSAIPDPDPGFGLSSGGGTR